MNIFKQATNTVDFKSLLKQFIQNRTGNTVFYETIEQENKDNIQISFIANIQSLSFGKNLVDLEIHIFSNSGSNILELEEKVNELYNIFNNANCYLVDGESISIRTLDVNMLNVADPDGQTEPNLRRRDLDVRMEVYY